ncbi:MAG: hypothetical protein K8R69_12215 [Deltaproteobacteria bacterium]|nr:hypothetical protein [Deltaproteobacteria bacterium]
MERLENWFLTLNQKLEKIDVDLMGIRGELGDIREFIEHHQTDIRICKLAIERVDDKVESLRKHS